MLFCAVNCDKHYNEAGSYVLNMFRSAVLIHNSWHQPWKGSTLFLWWIYRI